jgi:hypothetical protein
LPSVAAACLFWPDLTLGDLTVPAYATDAVGGILPAVTFLRQRAGWQRKGP